MIDIDIGNQVFDDVRTYSCERCEVMYGLPSESEPEGDGGPCLVGNGHNVQDVV
jgi:hypothetical protein